MSHSGTSRKIRPRDSDGSEETWEEIAEYRDLLEEIVAEDMEFAPYARRLLAELDRRGL